MFSELLRLRPGPAPHGEAGQGGDGDDLEVSLQAVILNKLSLNGHSEPGEQ